jgi:hypothetical protein
MRHVAVLVVALSVYVHAFSRSEDPTAMRRSAEVRKSCTR